MTETIQLEEAEQIRSINNISDEQLENHRASFGGLYDVNNDGEIEYEKINKRKIYIDSPTEAPDGKEVHQGDKGGYYYVSGDEEEGGEEDQKTFEDKLESALKNNELHEISCAEFGENIDKIRDEDLLEDAYKEESREAVRREIEEWAGQLNRVFEYNYKIQGPKRTDSLMEFTQVQSLTDEDIDLDELDGSEEKAVEMWESFRKEAEKEEKIDVEKRREFRNIAEKVDNDSILQHLWERGLGGFEDLNTHLSDILYERGYSPRTEMISGTLRRLDLKYDYDLEQTEGQVADAVETGDVLRRNKQHELREDIETIDNADFLNDLKFACLERGVKEDSAIINSINKRLANIDCRSVESFNIRYDVYKDILSRPAGMKGSGQGISRDAWRDVWENVSTGDLEEFVDICEDRNNEAYASIVQGMLCYREECSLNARDVIDLQFINGDMNIEDINTELERILSELDPVIGTYLIAQLSSIRSERLESNKESYVLFRGMIGMDGRGSDKIMRRLIFSHMIGHILHDLMGLDVKDEVEEDEEEMGEGWEYPVIQPKDEDNEFLQEFYVKMRKEWKRYTSKDARECRIYQRVAPSEFMACTFALWISDSAKLKIIHEEMNTLYNDFLGDT